MAAGEFYIGPPHKPHCSFVANKTANLAVWPVAPNTPANTLVHPHSPHTKRLSSVRVPVCVRVYEPIIINARKAALKMSELVSHPNLYATKSKHIRVYTHVHAVLRHSHPPTHTHIHTNSVCVHIYLLQDNLRRLQNTRHENKPSLSHFNFPV